MSKFIHRSKSGQSENLTSESGANIPLSEEKELEGKGPLGLLSKSGNPVPNSLSKSVQSNKPLFGTKQRPLYRHPLLWVTLAIATSLGGGAAYLHQVWQELEERLPQSVASVMTYTHERGIVMKADDGTLLKDNDSTGHQELKIKQIPNLVVQAFIASQDPNFLKHDGVDYLGSVRAILSNVQAGEVVAGGTTLTQQLGRMVYLSNERDVLSKIKEIRIAQKIEKQFEKEQILERYINLVGLGSGSYGVGDAAWVYFGKSVHNLTLIEAATLAGIAPAPDQYSPLKNPEAAKQQRDRVLGLMRDRGYISAGQAAMAIAAPLALNPQKPKTVHHEAPYFTDYVLSQLPSLVSPQTLEAGDLTIETTLNRQWQEAAEAAIAKTLSPKGSNQNISQGALVAVDPRTGEIKAMVGGKDYANPQENGLLNHATETQRPPGSTFKTFIYAAAIAAGFDLNKPLKDRPYIVDGTEFINPNNDYQGSIPLQKAVTEGANVPAVKTLIDVGWQPVINLVQKMGIKSELQPNYALALGTAPVNLLELTSAYGTFANQGLHHPVTAIKRILDRQGNVLYQAQGQGEQALDADSAAIMTDILTGVVQTGNGEVAKLGDRPVAGQIGTSPEARDLWFISYIPQLVAGVWLGNDSNQPTGSQSTVAAGVWQDFMGQVSKSIPPAQFPKAPAPDLKRKPFLVAQPLQPKQSYYREPPVARGEEPENRPQKQQRLTNRDASPRRIVSSPRRRQQANPIVSAPETQATQPRRVISRRLHSPSNTTNSVRSRRTNGESREGSRERTVTPRPVARIQRERRVVPRPTQRPVARVQREPRVVPRPVTRRPAAPRVTQRPVARRPAVRRRVAQQPAPRRPVVRRRVAQQPTPRRPVVRRRVAQQPAPRRPVVRRRVAQQPAPRRPVSRRPVSRRPVAQRPATRRPVSRRPVAQRPAARRPVEQRPAPSRPVTQRPVPRVIKPIPAIPTTQPPLIRKPPKPSE